ncbi:hypothetical protein [Paracoccus sp. SCSIO 75233]|uniref:hypothetical protein n=1 Tax=Paracoccus sp. SCSIO 75233 TaxID=3017782 RepID=UPI0022F11843|nr:hypothetical protein [Paracoccus sp. SCSIO 75233]WBU52150.1 hypothetical protein PAF12_09905 [Paracoccus sp. SCSIO 75233]
MIRLVFAVTFMLAGCASQVMQGYIGKDVTEVMMDYGRPSGAIDLPDGRRAFIWQKTESMMMPATTNYSGYETGGYITGMATTTGGISEWECVYTFIGQKNGAGSYTIVDFRKPKLECE